MNETSKTVQILVSNQERRSLGNIRLLKKYCVEVEILKTQHNKQILLTVPEENLSDVRRILQQRKHYTGIEWEIIDDTPEKKMDVF